MKKTRRLFHSCVTFRVWTWTTVFALNTLSLHAGKNNKLIHVFSEASDQYLAQRSSDKSETYKFYEGKSFKEFAGKSLKNVEFESVVRGLVPQLAKQNYLPAKINETCDLLLVVTWGKTNPIETWNPHDGSTWRLPGSNYDDLVADSYIGKGVKIDEAARSAKLLGFYPFLDNFRFKPHYSAEESELMGLLMSERYFIVVTAFDYQALVEEKQWKGLWATRFSMRSAGVDFNKAHLALSKAGADYFGKNLEKLGEKRVDLNSAVGEVEIGEIEVLETIEAPGRDVAR